MSVNLWGRKVRLCGGRGPEGSELFSIPAVSEKLRAAQVELDTKSNFVKDAVMTIRENEPSDMSSLSLSRNLSRIIRENHKRMPFYEGLRLSLGDLQTFAQGCVTMSMRYGICEPFYEGRELKALLVVGKVHLAPGLPLLWGFIEALPSRSADEWILRKLEEHRSFFTPDSMLELPANLRHLLPKLYRAGYFIDTVRTWGDPKTAYRRLMQKRNPDDHRNGYTIEKMNDVRNLEELRVIQKREFLRNPQFGWFVASEAWLEHSLRMRKQNIDNPEACQYLIKKRGRVLGYFGYTPTPGYFKGKCVGTEFIFDERIQGLGFSKIGYRLLLENMQRSGVDYFSGNTSQKPVMKLSKLMGRVPQNYALRSGIPSFPLAHFMG